jgi:adenylate cyclase
MRRRQPGIGHAVDLAVPSVLISIASSQYVDIIRRMATKGRRSVADSGLKAFWSELRRRKVVRAAVVYIIVAWLVVEVSSVLFPNLLLPDWSERLVLAMAIIGFPLVLVLAWAFDLAPDGLHRERTREEVARESSADALLDAGGGESTRAAPPASAAPASASPARSDDRRSIAVLPLANMSGDPENEFFSDGIAEEILNLLARQPDLRVVSRTSSFSFKNTALDVPTIAEKLDVDIVLEGSVRRAGNRVRIVAQLIDAASDAHLWSDSYDRELEDIFAVQTEIAKCIVDAMNLNPDTCIDCGGNTQDIEAYDYYLRGKQYFHQTTNTSIEFARRMFTKAIEIDPDYARAHAGLAYSETMLAQWVERTEERLAAADQASRRALELAPDLAEAHAARGFVLSIDNDYEGAAEHFDRALELDPLHYESLYLYGRARYAQGEMNHAMDLWARAHDAQPDEFQSLALAAGNLRKLGRVEEDKAATRLALKLIERRLELNPDDLRALSLGPGVLIDLGREEEALAMADHAVALAPTDGGVLHNAACSYAHAGKADKAIELLERRMQVSATIDVDWINNDSDFDSIRDDPRFKSLMARIQEQQG